jgi:pyruvate dehydrogenase E2 component (dihydrolipoamide acetyltransferase)
MQASWQTIPHVFQFDKADITNLETFRNKYGKEVEKAGGKLTITVILLENNGAGAKNISKFQCKP